MELPEPHINSSGITDYPRGTSLGPRVLRDYEFVWIERGDCVWAVDGNRVACPPGTVVLCKPGMQDRFQWDPDRTTRHGYIHFEIPDPENYFLPLFRRAQGADVLRPLLRQAAWLAEQESDWLRTHAREALRQALYWFIVGFFSQEEGDRPREQPPALTRVFEVIVETWNEDPARALGVAELADRSGISRGYLARLCKSHLGVSPQALLRLLRLEHAVMLLTRSDLEVQAVSELCGFANPFHFSRCCKQAYGLAPSTIQAQAALGAGRPPSAAPGIRRLYQQLIAAGAPARAHSV